MDKKTFTLVKVGRLEHLVNFKKITKWHSKLFRIDDDILSVDYLPEGNVSDGYLDQKFSREDLGQLINCLNNTNIVVALMAYRFTDNF